MPPLRLVFSKISRYSMTVLLLLLLCFSPVVQPIATANAFFGGGPGGSASLGMQVAQQGKLAASAVANTATAASSAFTANTNFQDFSKQFLLDGIAWSVAKSMVSQMTQSMVDWINSGFEGNPAFITDLDRFLVDALDETAGQFISSLTGDIICSPFQLDVQFALEYNYAQARSGMPTSCRLSDIQGNIENFLGGFNEGGLDNWLSITANPTNTPYGSYLEAEKQLSIRLRNAAGKEIEYAGWGKGFLSNKVCNAIEGTATENCTITTPGRVVSEALTFQLSAGPRSLIEADEFNEIIVALINQISLQAMEGVGGLLGLTAGTGFTDYSEFSTPYLDRARAQEASAFAATQTNGLNTLQDEADRAIAINNAIEQDVNEADAAAQNNPRELTVEEQIAELITSEEAFIRRIDAVRRETNDQIDAGNTASELRDILDETEDLRAQSTANLQQLRRYQDELDEFGLNPIRRFLVESELDDDRFFEEEFIIDKIIEWDEILEP